MPLEAPVTTARLPVRSNMSCLWIQWPCGPGTEVASVAYWIPFLEKSDPMSRLEGREARGDLDRAAVLYGGVNRLHHLDDVGRVRGIAAMWAPGRDRIGQLGDAPAVVDTGERGLRWG